MTARHEPHPLHFATYRSGFHASPGSRHACFLTSLLKGKQIVWQWRIHSADMASRLAEGTCPTPDSAEAAMRAWLANAPAELPEG